MKIWYKIIPSEENRVVETFDKVWGPDHAICVPDGRQVRWCSQPPWSDILVNCGVWAGLVGAPPLGLPSWCSVSSCNGFSPFVFKKKNTKNIEKMLT
jgi:hypothetical protein